MSKYTLNITIETEVDESWVDLCVNNCDMFMTDHIGYWAQGIGHSKKPDKGWLVFECGGDEEYTQEELKAALKAWREDQPLPSGWYRMDRQAVEKAWCEGVKKWGVDWYENSDATSYDVVLQLALLGEVRYG